VGQGDSIFIETPEGVQVLIDGGPDGGVLRELQKLMPYFDRSIDIVIATHPDRDHIGGLPDIFERFEVTSYITAGTKSDSGTYSYLQEVIEEEQAQHVIIDRPMSLALGGKVKLDILFPTRDASLMESNASSVIVELIYGEHEFLFTGDSPKSIEKYLASIYGTRLDAEVLKVGHHGSKTSSAESFIDTVNPEYAIISAGEDNRYGHPHKEVVERFVERNAAILETKNGAVIFISDGEKLWIK